MTSSSAGARARPRRRPALFILLSALLTSSASFATEPAPADKAVCADSYRDAQVHRNAGRLRSARERLLVCASDQCPSVLQPDCTRWLTEVEAALPSVTFAAIGREGRDVTDVRVSIDGEVLSETLDGKSIPLDPGSHTVRFERAGEAPVEKTIIVREGEKARVVSATWEEEPAALPPTPPPRQRSGPPVSAWVLGGVGVSAVGAFAALAIDGMNRRSALEKSCFGSCQQEQVDSIKTQLAVADAALGVGLVSLGVSAVLFLSGRGPSEEAAPKTSGARPSLVGVGIGPRKDGASIGLTGRF